MARMVRQNGVRGGTPKRVKERDLAIGHRIKAAREKKGLSQHKLAILLGLTAGAVGQWELGANSPRGERLAEVADALGVDVNFLQYGQAPEDTARAAAIGARIRQARLAKDISIRALAAEFDVPPSTVAEWESGAVDLTMSQLKGIAARLGVSVDELLIGESAEERGIAQTQTEKRALALLRAKPGKAGMAAIHMLEQWPEGDGGADPTEALAVAEAVSHLEPDIGAAVVALISGLRHEKLPNVENPTDEADMISQAAALLPLWSRLSSKQRAALMVVLKHFQAQPGGPTRASKPSGAKRSKKPTRRKTGRHAVENSALQ